MMPHLAEECWTVLGYTPLVATEAWPDLEADLLLENTVTLPVQINGRKRADVTVARDAKNPEIEAAVLELDAVKRALDGKPPKKVIVVPHRSVNVVAGATQNPQPARPLGRHTGAGGVHRRMLPAALCRPVRGR